MRIRISTRLCRSLTRSCIIQTLQSTAIDAVNKLNSRVQASVESVGLLTWRFFVYLNPLWLCITQCLTCEFCLSLSQTSHRHQSCCTLGIFVFWFILNCRQAQILSFKLSEYNMVNESWDNLRNCWNLVPSIAHCDYKCKCRL